MKQAVLILGATGFIGGRIVAALAASERLRPVLGTHRRPASDHGDLERRTLDATRADPVREALRDISAVINCVAGDPQTLVSCAQALAQAAAGLTRPPRIVHLSTMSVYGSTTGEVGEATPLRGDLGPYSAAKIAAESALSGYSDAVILRPGCVFGPGSTQWSGRIARFLLSGRLGALGAAGEGYCNLVHVDDVALAACRALEREHSPGRAFNLVVPEPPTWNAALVEYARALRAPPVRTISTARLTLESKLLAPPLKLAEVGAKVLGLRAASLPPPLPPSLVRLMAQRIRLDSRHARSALGIPFKDVAGTLADSAAWVLGSAAAH